MHVYVDSSMSMRGFVASPGARYFETLDRLLDDAQSAGFSLAIDSFAGSVQELGPIKTSRLLEPTFYSGVETSFPRLFQHVARERGHGTISVIVTDLVQSGTTGDQRALLASIQEVTRSNPEIKLLAFRSAFHGTYYVEGRKTGRNKLELTLEGGSRENSRPFFILIIADSPQDIETVRQYLQPEVDLLTGEKLPLELNATGPALKVEKVEPGPPSTPVIWNVFEAAREMTDVRHRVSPFLLSFSEIAPPAAETTSLRLTLKTKRSSEDGDLRSPEGLRVEVRRCSFKAHRATVAEPVDIPWEAVMPSRDHIEMAYTLPRPKPHSWDAYQIRISPGPGNLRPPDWALEWSTIDDSIEKNGSRTLKLDVFIDTIIRSIKEKIPFSESYILLGRGD